MKLSIAIIVIVSIFQLSACSNNNSNNIDTSIYTTINPTEQNSSLLQVSNTPTVQDIISNPTPTIMPALKSTPQPQSTKKSVVPFPDDGKVASWTTSLEFPDFAYNKPETSKELYLYSLNQQTSTKSSGLTVLPVNFYYQTTVQTRNSLIKYYKDFITSYYTQDYTNIEEWSNNMRGFCDPKSPVTLINGKLPNDFIIDTTNKMTSSNLKINIISIFTDDSLLYLDSEANYRVRGRVLININSSTDPSLTVGTHTYDVELSFKKKLLAGPDNWSSKDFIIHLIIILK